MLHQNSFNSVIPAINRSYLRLFLWFSYKKVLSSKENIGIDAWHEIRKKFTMLRASFCKYRKSRDSFNIFNFFIFVPNKAFSELFSKT